MLLWLSPITSGAKSNTLDASDVADDGGGVKGVDEVAMRRDITWSLMLLPPPTPHMSPPPIAAEQF